MKPEKLLQKLIQFDTANPPGNEKYCIDFIYNFLKKNGLKPIIIAKDANRPNLVVRIKVKKSSPPLLLYGHIDVAQVNKAKWEYPPFEGIIKNGYIWGRSTLDMKSGICIFLMVLTKIINNKFKPNQDIILCILSDEENYGEYGAKYIVDKYSYLFNNVKYAISELGGFQLNIFNKRFYPIQVTEKKHATIYIKVSGKGGHGALRIKNNVILKTAKIIKYLNKIEFPVYINKVNKEAINIVLKTIPVFFKIFKIIFLLTLLIKLLKYHYPIVESLFCNTYNLTVIKKEGTFNVIPGKVKMEVDCRILPGSDINYLIHVFKNKFKGNDIKIKLIESEYNISKINKHLLPLLENVIKRIDPKGITLPYMLPASTDAMYFSKLGIQTYGFIPLKFSKGLLYFHFIHNSNEKINLESLSFGINGIHELILHYKG